ncbi:MAG: histone deacetylase [Candidatus Aminicenantales bacterium]
MKTGIVKDRRYLDHNMGDFHVESPRRIEAVYRMIEKEITFPYLEIQPRRAREEEVELIHAASYMDLIKQTAGKPYVYLDPDTSTSARSYETALLAVGGLLAAADLILDGKIQNGFALVRPPGHHAEYSWAKGFCIFNNAAIAAAYLLKKRGLKRVLIVDWDIHHGNGTQNSFYTSKDVLYFSTHQYPHYPGSGSSGEVGADEGEGYTINVPLRAGKGNQDYLYIFQKILRPAAAAFRPEFILVSAGFDVSRGDPLGGMDITGEGFSALTAELLTLAGELCRNQILFTLEGGYSLPELTEGVKTVLLQLSGEAASPIVKAEASEETERELAPVFAIQKKYWPIEK